MAHLNLTSVPEPAKRILKELVTEIEHKIPGIIKGVYITGSIPLHDFYPNKSDIDFLITCNFFPNEKLQSLLKDIHYRISKNFKRPYLSGHYTTTDCLATGGNAGSDLLSFHEGRLCYNNNSIGVVTLYELKTTAHTVLGTVSNQLPITIDVDDVKQFLYANINDYWVKWIKMHSSFHERKLLLVLIPLLTEWAVLGVARQLYTLQTGKIASKSEAGLYCLKLLPDKFHNILQQAVKIRQDDRKRHQPGIRPPYYLDPSLPRCYETTDCVNYMIQLFNNLYQDSLKANSK